MKYAIDLKYYVGLIMSLPLLPSMYFQSKKIRKTMPKLPEAVGTNGFCTINEEMEKPINLITIGESTIAGVGVETHEEGFTGTLAKELSELLQVNVDWNVYAKSGFTAKKVVNELLPKIKERSIDLIVIGLGANDAFTLNSPKNWGANLRNLIETLRSRYPESFITFINIPPIKEFPAFTSLIKMTLGNLGELLGQRLEELVADYDNVYFASDILTVHSWIEKFKLNVHKSAFFSDGVHPSKLTYQTWAKDIAIRISSHNKIADSLKFRMT